MPDPAGAWRLAILALLAVVEIAVAVRAIRADRSDAACRCLAGLLLVGAGIAIWFGLRALPLDAQQRMLPLYHPLALGPLVHIYARLRLGGPIASVRLHAVAPVAALVYQLALWLMPAAAFAVWKEGAHDHLVKPALDYASLISMIGYAAASLQLVETMRKVRPAEAVRAVARVGGTLAASAFLLSGLRIYNWFVAEARDAQAFWVFLALAAAPLLIWTADRPVRAARREAAENRHDEVRQAGVRWKEKIIEEEWWREPDLTLQEAARRLGTNASYLSRALNRGIGQSFPELLNRLRAEQVARQLEAQPRAERLLDLAFEAGFSSKATFNRAFRSTFGCAPSEYVSLHEKRTPNAG